MALFRRSLNRCIPLLLAFVILVSLFPVVPVFAAEAASTEGELVSGEGELTEGEISSGDAAAVADYTISGVWTFYGNPSISVNTDFSQSVNFTSNGSSYSKFTVNPTVVMGDPGSIEYGSKTVYSDGAWSNSAYKTLDFGATPQSVSSSFYNFFSLVADQTASYYSHTISISGSSYAFSAKNSAPPVTIKVTSTGFTMTYGSTTKTWTYSGSDTFVGIQDSSGNTYDVGASFSLLGSSGANKTSTLTPLTQAEPDPVTYSVYLDDSLLFSAPFTTDSVTVELQVYDDYFRVWFYGYDETYYHREDYTSNDYQFSGLSLSDPDLNVRDYKPNNTYEITLASSSPTLNLYSVMWPYVEIDPNGGTWQDSSDVSIWAAPEEDGGPVVNPVRSGYLFDGWTLTGAGTLAENPNSTTSSYIYTFGDGVGYLTANWVEDPAAVTYTHTIIIDGTSFEFSAEGAAPPVTIQVTSTGVTMSHGSTTKTWTYSGSDTFAGIQDSSGTTYDVDASFSVLGSSSANKTSTFTVLTEAASDDTSYSTTITIDGTPFVFTAANASPDVLITCSETGCTLTSNGVSKVWTYSGSGDFAGLSLSSGGTPFVSVGGQCNLPGSDGKDYTYTLYSVIDSSDTYTATFTIGEETYVFTSADAVPSVTITVLAGGLDLSDGTTTYFHEHGTNVLGYKLSVSSDSYISIGESYIFTKSSSYTQVLYPFYNDDATYVTSVNIYNSTGTKLLGTYDFLGVGSAPVVSLTVLGNGCTLVSGDTSYSWDSGTDPFYGFSPARDVAKAYYVPGNMYELPGGEPTNLSINLYVHDTEYSLPTTDFVSWLKTAVGGFLTFEIYPGLSLDEIVYFILVVQLLLWFLKLIK